ncbi:hypothetical protein C8R45DRAFT_1107972 [Mycena sanguinolenta]|nr:hypothetical protein C8R45DRAFT_1107972 [Mycena sanguinolenta]
MCRGTTDGKPCDCEAYDAPLKADAPSKCLECGHGKSRHPAVIQPTVSVATASRQGVMDAFNLRADKKISEHLPAKDRVTDLSAAKADAMRGYRVVDPEAAKKGKGNTKLKAATHSKSKDTVVSEVVLLTCGLNRKGDKLIGSAKAPSMVEIERRSLHQCVASDVTWAPEWTHQACTTKLTGIFRVPFEWLASVGGDWMVLSKAYNNLHVVPKLEPTGSDGVKYKIPKTATRGTMLYIALSHEVPNEVYQSWYTGPPVQESSSVIDGEENFIDIDSQDENMRSSDYHPTQDVDASDTEIVPRAIRHRAMPHAATSSLGIPHSRTAYRLSARATPPTTFRPTVNHPTRDALNAHWMHMQFICDYVRFVIQSFRPNSLASSENLLDWDQNHGSNTSPHTHSTRSMGIAALKRVRDVVCVLLHTPRVNVRTDPSSALIANRRSSTFSPLALLSSILSSQNLFGYFVGGENNQIVGVISGSYTLALARSQALQNPGPPSLVPRPEGTIRLCRCHRGFFAFSHAGHQLPAFSNPTSPHHMVSGHSPEDPLLSATGFGSNFSPSSALLRLILDLLHSGKPLFHFCTDSGTELTNVYPGIPRRPYRINYTFCSPPLPPPTFVVEYLKIDFLDTDKCDSSISLRNRAPS